MENSWHGKIIEAVCQEHGWDYNAPLKALPPEALDYILFSGRGERVVIGYRHERGEKHVRGHVRGHRSQPGAALPGDGIGLHQVGAGALHGRPAVPDVRG